MLAFSPDDYLQTKVNICSCNVCIKDEFTSCSHEVGKKLLFNHDSDEETSGSESDEEFECEDIINNEEDTTEKNEIRADCVVDAVEPGSYIALYSSPELFEMFYLCHVIAKQTASDDIVDDYNQTIGKDTKYLKCKYLEKRLEKKVVFPTNCYKKLFTFCQLK